MTMDKTRTLSIVILLCLGLSIAQDVDECSSNPCEHGGTCTVGDYGQAECECVDGFSGIYCGIIYGDRCLSVPCLWGAKCTSGGPNGYYCDCPDQFEGGRCTDAVNPELVCHSDPCMNGGTCTVDLDNDDYVCSCLNIFTGHDCEEMIEGELEFSGTTIKHPDNAELSGKVLDDEIEMESTGGVGGVAQISDEMEIDDVDSEDDNFENVSSDEEGYQSGCDERDEFTFEINVDEELIKYAKDF